MARPYNACTSPSREAIDTALVTGATLTVVARDHGLSEAGVARHRANHIRPLLRQAAEREEAAQQEREDAERGTRLQRLSVFHVTRAKELIDELEMAPPEARWKFKPAALREFGSAILTLGRVSGELVGDGGDVVAREHSRQLILGVISEVKQVVGRC